MKILLIDKYFFIKGGAERYYFELMNILEKNGHQVIPFAMKHKDNYESEYQDYFLENIEFNNLSTMQKLQQAPNIISRIIYSKAAKKALDKLASVFTVAPLVNVTLVTFCALVKTFANASRGYNAAANVPSALESTASVAATAVSDVIACEASMTSVPSAYTITVLPFGMAIPVPDTVFTVISKPPVVLSVTT